jgi:metallo-beta-lactamase family protein
MTRLQFLGAAGTVTGSRTLLTHDRARLLVDCGLFQGFKALRQQNWKPLPIDVAQLDAVVLTHAHLDHSGAVPLLVRQGYAGPVHATAATADLCRVVWPDAAWLQEEEAERANRKGYSRHHPARPLFEVKDAEKAVHQLVEHPFDVPFPVDGARVTFRQVGHILGAASALIEVDGRRILFSGDVGRTIDPMHAPPEPPPAADLMVLESTYGGRHHPPTDPEEELAGIVTRTVARGGHVIIPSFAVGRTQRVLLHLLRLRRRHAIPAVPVFLNSPLASRATEAFWRHPEAHTLSPEEARAVGHLPIIVESPEASRELNRREDPCIIIAGSGMATGGRVVHHLQAFLPDPRHTVVFTGFQAEGTRGDRLVRGEPEIKVFGRYVPVHAEIRELANLSAHADQEELIRWVDRAEAKPGRVLLNHGTPAGCDALRLGLEERLGIQAEVPLQGDAFDV